MRNALVGIIAALAVIGIYISITGQKVAGPWFAEPIASTSISTPSPDVPEDWKEYKNETYDFSLKYPGMFSDFVEDELVERSVYAYDSTTKKVLEKKIKPIAYLKSSSLPISNNSDQSITLMVFKAEDYGFSDIPGGRAWSYQYPAGNLWQGGPGATSSWARINPTAKGEGWEGFEIGTGDAGYSVKAIVLPLKDKSRVLEIAFAKGPASAAEIPEKQILSSLRFP